MTALCRICRLPLYVEDALQQIWTYAGVELGVVHTAPEPEVAHYRCETPTAPAIHPNIEVWQMRTTPSQPLPKRSPAHQCLLCGKMYARGDRFAPIYRAQSVQHDPVANRPNVLVESDWETGHIRCDDPQLQQVHAPLLIS